MLKFRESVITFFLIFSILFAQEKASSEKAEEYKKRYEEAVNLYKKGSYYSAIDTIYPVLLNPENPYYPYGLFLMSKIYLHVGKKTGKKDFLVKALYFLNTYLYSSKDATDHWDFYFTRGNIYENLFQYEKALSDYKISYIKAKTQKEQTYSIISLLRTAAWTSNLDIATKYLILINIEELSKKEKSEFYFVKGLLAFKQEDYKNAFFYLSKVYKKYEQLLIDNPYYYLIVAETAYRYGNIKFSQQLFRRIISSIKDPYIIRQALIRLGDIEIKQKHPVYGFNYYYSIIEKYPKSREASIAKLKILAEGISFKKIKEKINYLKKEDEDFKKSFRFVFKTWISNRNNYLGDFSFGNLGYIILGYKSEKLFKKLIWELSLLSPYTLKYEHIEHIKPLWKPRLLEVDIKKLCSLYTTNPEFFKKVFYDDRKVIVRILNALFSCGKISEELDLSLFIDKKWNNRTSHLLLAKAYLDNKEYQKAINILSKTKDSSCLYFKIKIQASLLLGKKPDMDISNIEKVCKEDEEAKIYEGIAFFLSGKKNKAINTILSVKNLSLFYEKDPFIKNSIKKLLIELLSKKNYKEVYKISIKILKEKPDDCFFSSIGLISGIRLNKGEELSILYKNIVNCSLKIANIAKNMYKDYIVEKEIKKNG